MQMDGPPVLIPCILFWNSALLTDKPCNNFMLKYDTQNEFRQFTKILSEKFNF